MKKNIEDKVPDITNLATNTALTAVEDKISYVNNLVKKLTIIQELMTMKRQLLNHDHDEYVTTPKLNKVIAESFAAKISTSKFSKQK